MGTFYIFKKIQRGAITVVRGTDSAFRNDAGMVEGFFEPYTIKAKSAGDALALFFMNEPQAREEKDNYMASENENFASDYAKIIR